MSSSMLKPSSKPAGVSCRFYDLMASLKGTAIKRARTNDEKTKAEAETLNRLSKQPDEDLTLSPGDKLCEDELTIIFSSYWISTQDLLNFRLVNKSWRDAATTTLLQRDACYVTMNITTAKANAGDGAKSCGWNRRNEKARLNTPQRLTKLMSNSPKFPVSNFRIHTCHLTDYADSADLLLFFKLHGEKVKSLGPLCNISQQQLLNIRFSYAPKLECLDLSCADPMRVSLGHQDNDKKNPSKWSLKFLPIKSIIFGHGGVYYSDYNAEAYQAFLHLLLSSKSNLSCIDARLSQLAHVLEEGKGGLITSFHFYDTEESASSIALVNKYLELNPKLSKLSLNLSGFKLCEMTLAPINALIRSSRNTLRDLNLHYPLTEGGAKFQIPPMKHLQKLTLRRSAGDHYFRQKVCHFFQFTDGTLGDKYFPSLLTFKMHVLGPASIKASLASFFDDSPGNSFLNVDILEMRIIYLGRNSLKNFKFNLTILSKAFPNLRMIKLECDQIRHLSSSLWMLHSLEFIEIYNISRNYRAPADFCIVSFVDKFFTGFSIDWCQKFQNKKVPKHMDNPRMLKLLRVRPSICDLTNLKELKLKFSPDFCVRFASKITADYAFSKMPDTKFIVSYDSDKIDEAEVWSHYNTDNSSDDSEDDYCKYWSYGKKIDDDSDGDEDEELPVGNIEIKEDFDEKDVYEEMCFGPIKKYIQIVREKQCC